MFTPFSNRYIVWLLMIFTCVRVWEDLGLVKLMFCITVSTHYTKLKIVVVYE